MVSKEVNTLAKGYATSGLLVDHELLKAVRRKLKGVPRELPRERLHALFQQYRSWPLMGQLEVQLHALAHGTVSQEQQQRLARLERAYQVNWTQKPYQLVFSADLEESRRHVLRFAPEQDTFDDLRYLLIQNGACYADKRRLDDITRTFHDDAILGGSIIFSVQTTAKRPDPSRVTPETGKDRYKNPILAVGKIFVGLDRSGTPVLSADHYSFGSYHSKTLEDWAREGKAELFGYGPSAMLYFAERLGINRLIFCDREMAEFGKQCGFSAKSVFAPLPRGQKYDTRKLGIATLTDNSCGVWNHGHSVYSHDEGKSIVADIAPLSFESLQRQFETTNGALMARVGGYTDGRLTLDTVRSARVSEHFAVMHTVLRVMENLYLNHRRFGWLKSEYNAAVDVVAHKAPGFSTPHVR